MKNASAAVIALLNGGGSFYMADLLTFTLVSGTVARYAIYDKDLTVGGYPFAHAGPVFARDNIRLTLGVEVGSLGMSVYPKPADLIGGLPWLQVAAQGYLDGATVQLDRAFMSSPGVVVGTINLFTGRVADVNASRTEITLTVNSWMELLNVQLPRNLYQSGCQHTLYDADCGVNKAAFAVSGTVVSASSTQIASNLTQDQGYFDLGTIVFVSGILSGVKRTVKSYTGGVIFPLNPLPYVPSAGDTFNIYPGCDKTLATCINKFNNKANFRGFPFIPVPETSV